MYTVITSTTAISSGNTDNNNNTTIIAITAQTNPNFCWQVNANIRRLESRHSCWCFSVENKIHMFNIKMTAEEKQHIEMIAKAPNWCIPSWYQSKLPQDYSNKREGLKNRQQTAVWSNGIWLVAKCVTVASIRAGGEETVSERLPCGRVNGFAVLPDRVYRPYIMFFFLFWNVHFSHLFGERMLRLGNRAWKESNVGSTPVALNGYGDLHLIWNFSCIISEHFVLLRDNSSQIIFRLCSLTSWAGNGNPNRNQVNTSTGGIKLASRSASTYL